MGTTYALKAVVKDCPIHKAIRDRCAEKLEMNGFFRKSDILNELDFSCVSDSIRWDYLREFIETDQGCQLIPLAEPFFKRHKHTDVPATYVAIGRSKKAVGYASVTDVNGALAIRLLQHKKAVANGSTAALNKYVASLHDKHLIEEEHLPLLKAS